MSTERILTDEQLDTALEMFAIGKSRTEIAQYFIDTDESINEQEFEYPQKTRNALSNALRVVDPSSEQFSKTKYAGKLQLHQDAHKSVLTAHYKAHSQRFVAFLQREIEKNEQTLEVISREIETATREHWVKGSSDISQAIALQIKLVEQQAKLHQTLKETVSETA